MPPCCRTHGPIAGECDPACMAVNLPTDPPTHRPKSHYFADIILVHRHQAAPVPADTAGRGQDDRVDGRAAGGEPAALRGMLLLGVRHPGVALPRLGGAAVEVRSALGALVRRKLAGRVAPVVIPLPLLLTERVACLPRSRMRLCG